MKPYRNRACATCGIPPPPGDTPKGSPPGDPPTGFPGGIPAQGSRSHYHVMSAHLSPSSRNLPRLRRQGRGFRIKATTLYL